METILTIAVIAGFAFFIYTRVSKKTKTGPDGGGRDNGPDAGNQNMR